MRRASACLAIALISATVLASRAEPAAAAALRDRLVFVGSTVGVPGGRLYASDPDGGNLTLISTASVRFPKVSPDGTRIAYELGSGAGVGVMDADGTNDRVLVSGAFPIGQPSWSPDGGRLAFVRTNDIWVMNADGTGQRQLTHVAGPSSFAEMPSWSPDGTRILFEGNRVVDGESRFALYVIDADGSGLSLLETGLRDSLTPRWSPDGTRIALTGDRSGGLQQLFVVDSGGAGARQLTSFGDETVVGGPPAWSPDGRRLVFFTASPAGSSISTIAADGSGLTKVPLGAGLTDAQMPDWSPVPRTPTTVADCLHGGWMLYGPMFRNQGQCVAFVRTGRHVGRR